MLDKIKVEYDTMIPNNVGLSSDKKVLKALERWHPGYINWSVSYTHLTLPTKRIV